MHQTLSKYLDSINLAAILLVALIVRLLGITSRPLWYDEAFAVLFAEKGPVAMLRGTLAPDLSGAAADIHPLAYYTVLWGWMKVFGESLVSVRMLSILFGLAIVLLVHYWLKAMFSDRRLALLGALGVALSPFQIHYSQEIRMYALMALALVGATASFWQALKTDERRWWALFAICAAFAEYTQSLAAFYLLPLALTPVFWGRWDKVKMTFFAGVGALLLYLPWLLQLPGQLAKIQNAYWVERPTFINVFTTLLSYVTNLPVDDPWIPLALTVTLMVTVLAAYQTLLALRNGKSGARRGLWLAYLAFAPAILMFVFSQWKPVFIERALLPSGVMFCLWLAWVLSATGLPRLLRALVYGLLIAGFSLGLLMHLTYTGFPYGPFAALDASLESRLTPGDLILHSNKLSALPGMYYDRSLRQAFMADPAGSDTDTLAPATQQVLGIQASSSLDAVTSGTHHIWFIIFQESIDEAVKAGLSTHPQITWLDAHFKRQSVEIWGALVVYVYTR